MGWKAIKDTYNIRHTVHVSEGKVCIGSHFVSKLAWIDPVTGEIHADGMTNTAEMMREAYPALMSASPEELLALLAKEDTFEASIPVYTYQDGEIIQKFCEVPDWPNVTHDGDIMYENVYYLDKQEAISSAKISADLRVESTIERVEQAEKDLAVLKSQLVWRKAEQLALKKNYPDVEALAEAE